LVEDNKSYSEIIQQVLEFKGYKVKCAYDGVQAIDAAINEVFDLILIDNQMPLMDGFTAVKTIRTFNDKIPIISISCENDDEFINRCYENGMNMHIPKFSIFKAIQNNLIESCVNQENYMLKVKI